MQDKKIIDGAKKIAADLNSAGGQIKFARIVKAHFGWFELCKKRGLTWRQMGDVLASVGACREDDKPFTVGMISSTVWRAASQPAMRSVEPTEDRGRSPAARIKDATHREGSPRSTATNKTPAEDRVSRVSERLGRKPAKVPTKPQNTNNLSKAKKNNSALDREEIRRRMNRAAQARRG